MAMQSGVRRIAGRLYADDNGLFRDSEIESAYRNGSYPPVQHHINIPFSTSFHQWQPQEQWTGQYIELDAQ